MLEFANKCQDRLHVCGYTATFCDYLESAESLFASFLALGDDSEYIEPHCLGQRSAKEDNSVLMHSLYRHRDNGATNQIISCCRIASCATNTRVHECMRCLHNLSITQLDASEKQSADVLTRHLAQSLIRLCDCKPTCIGRQ